jgi:uncharacterized circularly permuted ATP-grasp superfamily protein
MKTLSPALWKKTAALLIFSALSLAAFPLWAQQKGYNEIFDASGRVRPEYREAYDVWSHLTDADRAAFLTSSRRAFEGDNALDAMPRMISAQEYDAVLKPGVEQRARAIRAFLQDYFSGRKTYAQSNVIPESVVQNLVHRSAEAGFANLVRPDMIAFMYGPDIIRDAGGTWRVIEDNPGFIGGVGDLKIAQELITKKYPELAQTLRYRKADAFYEALAARMKLFAAKFGGKAVMYMQTPGPDNEDKRLRKIFLDHGIVTVTQNTNQQLFVENDGVYMRDILDRSGAKQKVGFIFMNGEHWFLDPSHPASYERVLVNEAEDLLEELDAKNLRESRERAALLKALNEKPRNLKKLERLLQNSIYENDIAKIRRTAIQAEGLIEASLQGKVGLNYAPGLDFIGDKEFYLYVENMIRFYLHEEPLLHNIPTKRFGEVGTERLDSQVFDHVFANLSEFVIKKVDGRGGDSVWVGPKIKAEEIPGLKQKILDNPSEYIAQVYTPLSYMNDNIVDMRVIADVGPRSIFVTDTPWGRGLPMNGNGKVNLSDQGREITILINEGPWRMCKNTFMH